MTETVNFAGITTALTPDGEVRRLVAIEMLRSGVVTGTVESEIDDGAPRPCDPVLVADKIADDLRGWAFEVLDDQLIGHHNDNKFSFRVDIIAAKATAVDWAAERCTRAARKARETLAAARESEDAVDEFPHLKEAAGRVLALAITAVQALVSAATDLSRLLLSSSQSRSEREA